eukprot:TRINITY_DN10118_c0_g1_i9.p2 TRINITY_DN10118_c0_g1~~TRINITY_DN10118_c0_g1_i9.p2  ORF type:complete len:143 (-),score=23.71 TRINITY_DN10118_c0_g1_i9:159-587(-)
MVGTVRYASIKTHMGIEQSRRDDLFSLGYLMVYWLKGGLPWQGIKTKSKKERHMRIKDLKMAIGFDTLCKGLPKEFEEYLGVCYKLGFTEMPKYNYLRTLLKPDPSAQFDWTLLKTMEEEPKVTHESATPEVETKMQQEGSI